jgi:hypothetical protein
MSNGTRLPTTICVMVPVKLQGKKPSKNTGPESGVWGCHSIGFPNTCIEGWLATKIPFIF